MKKTLYLLIPLFAILLLGGCSTNDVDGEQTPQIDLNKYYELHDTAFAEFLDYNTKFQITANNKLPEGIVFQLDGKWYLSKELAATITSPKIIYLTQSAANITALQNAQYSGNYIKSIDGIQFFTEATSLYLTDTDVEGSLDLRGLTKLSVLQARRTYISELLLPPTITDVRCEPKTGATDDQKLKTLDLSACTAISNILLNGALIPATGLRLPENPTATITASLTGATGIPYPCSQAFYDKLADAASRAFFKVEGVRNLYLMADNNFALYLKYNMNELADGAEYKLPADLIVEGTGADAGKYFLDKDVAATATAVGINQTSGWDATLTAKGYNVTGKITNIDGIQFFTNITKLSMTSGATTGALDLSGLTRLTTLLMNSNFCTSVTLPASITQFNYNASSTATTDQKLASINLSGCSGLASVSLTNQNIGADGFTAPTAPTASEIATTLTGNPGVPFTTNIAFYNKLNAASKAFFTDPNLANISDFSLEWDAAGQKTTTRPTSWSLTASTPTDLATIFITNTPQLVMASTMAAETVAGNADAFGATIRRASVGTAADAIANGYYYTLAVQSSSYISFSSLTTNMYSSASGAQNVDIQYSTNGTSFTTIYTVSNIAAADTGTAVNVDLSALKNIPAGTVTFRLVPYNNGGSAAVGATYIVNSRANSTGPKVLTITGTTPK